MKLFGFSLNNLFGTASKRSSSTKHRRHMDHRHGDNCNHPTHRKGHHNKHHNRTHYKKHMKGRTRKYKMKGG
jgi:hypothetical protein